MSFERGIEPRAEVEIRRTESRDLRLRKDEFHVAAKPVIRSDIGENVTEGMQLPRPIGGEPAAAAEMTDCVRADLMAAQISRVHVFDALPHLVGGAAEADVRDTARVSGRLVAIAIGVGDEIDAGDEEGEMQPVAILVHLGGEVVELFPALQLGAIVECDLDELRRPFAGAPAASKTRSEKNAARPIGKSKSIEVLLIQCESKFYLI